MTGSGSGKTVAAERRGLVRKPKRFSINPRLYISKTGSETIG